MVSQKMILRLILILLQFTASAYGQADNTTVTFIAIGDWGDTLMPGQQQVAYAMASWAEMNEPQFIVTTGDNFYPNGVSSVNDPQWVYKWLNVYNNDSIADLPWYITVGNHDYGKFIGEEWAQVAYHQVEPRWVLPHLWYSFYKEAGSARVHFIMIDTEALRNMANGHKEMMDWLEEELRTSAGDWKIVVGHRNIYSVGQFGPVQDGNWNDLRPLLEQYGADVYLCGHDHNLQYISGIDERGGVHYIISGAGGALFSEYSPEAERLLNEVYGMTLHAFRVVWGFIGFRITGDEIYFEFVDRDEQILYSHAIRK